MYFPASNFRFFKTFILRVNIHIKTACRYYPATQTKTVTVRLMGDVNLFLPCWCQFMVCRSTCKLCKNRPTYLTYNIFLAISLSVQRAGLCVISELPNAKSSLKAEGPCHYIYFLFIFFIVCSLEKYFLLKHWTIASFRALLCSLLPSWGGVLGFFGLPPLRFRD